MCITHCIFAFEKNKVEYISSFKALSHQIKQNLLLYKTELEAKLKRVANVYRKNAEKTQQILNNPRCRIMHSEQQPVEK